MPKGVPRDTSIERTILHRLKITRGHLDSVIEMVETGKYCIDVIHQSKAIQGALKNIDETILKNHLETCVEAAIKKGKSKEVIAEVMQIINKHE